MVFSSVLSFFLCVTSQLLQMLSITVRQVNEIREGDDKKHGILDRAKGLRDGLSDRILRQHKDKANEQLAHSMQFLAIEHFPEECRDQFIYSPCHLR